MSGTQMSDAPPADLEDLSVLVPLAARLQIPRPVWISPPATGTIEWTLSSQIQNRPQRITYAVDPARWSISRTYRFADKNIVDEVVNVMIATQERQLFGRINPAILLFKALSLILIAVSAAMMWWRRRPTHVLGAPVGILHPCFSVLLLAVCLILGVLLPLSAASVVIVLASDRMVLRHLPGVRVWLSLSATARN